MIVVTAVIAAVTTHNDASHVRLGLLGRVGGFAGHGEAAGAAGRRGAAGRHGGCTERRGAAGLIIGGLGACTR